MKYLQRSWNIAKDDEKSQKMTKDHKRITKDCERTWNILKDDKRSWNIAKDYER